MISRDADIHTVNVEHTPTATALKGALDRRSQGKSLAVADLSMGAWQSNQVALEWFDQLGLAFPIKAPVLATAHLGPRWLSYADVIGKAIEGEALGRTVTRHALTLAEALVNHARTAPLLLAVLTPRFGTPWGDDNLQFLSFVIQGLTGTSATVLLCSGDETEDLGLPPSLRPVWGDHVATAAAPSQRSLGAIIPGTVPSVLTGLLRDYGGTAGWPALPNDTLIVPPELRRPPSAETTELYNQLSQMSVAPHWLRAYAQMHCDDDLVDEMSMIQHSWRCFAEGGHDLALRLAARAVACSIEDVGREVCRAQLCGLQIASYHFEEAAEQPEPSWDLPPGLRGFLLMAKGWGLTMSGRAPEGRDMLTAAREALRGRAQTTEYLYLKNISALSFARSGDTATAFQFELEIRELLKKAAAKADQRLLYVNSINLARLYRRARDYDLCLDRYNDAFATTMGSRTEAELMYSNVCYGRVATERGDLRAAFDYAFRAALHFCACREPEAMSSRFVQGVLRDFGWLVRSSAVMIEDMARQLAASIIEVTASPTLATELRQSLEADWSPPAFVTADAGRDVPAGSVAVGGPGWSVILAPNADIGQFEGQQHRALRRLLATLIGHLSGRSITGLSVNCIVDARNSREMAVTRHELMETCIRRGITEMQFGDERTHLNASTMSAIENNLQLNIGDAVRAITFEGDAAQVQFKRLWPDRTLADSAFLLRAAERKETLGALLSKAGPDTAATVIKAARELQEQAVLTLELAQDWPGQA